MMKDKTKYMALLATIGFGIWACLFFGFKYPNHFHYQEQFQLFLFTSDYFWNTVGCPGGLGDYLGRFLTQFYYSEWVGAFIMALLLVLLQLSVVFVTRIRNLHSVNYLLTFIPSLGFWMYLVDESAMLASLVSMILCLLAIGGVQRIRNERGALLTDGLIIPVFYWTLGPVVIVYTLFRLFDWYKMKRFTLLVRLSVGGGLLLYTVLFPLLARLVVAYPLNRLLLGLNYYRFPTIHPTILYVVWLACVAVPFIAIGIPPLKSKIRIALGVVELLFLVLVGNHYIFARASFEKEEVMTYDYLCRMGQWDKMIKMAEEKSPTAPMSVTCLNLALAKTDQLADRMFTFYQGGTAGLLPIFVRDFMFPLPTNEVYYQLGMINTSQRFAFEAMEAIPDYQKSVRCFVRLAETNIINGQYEVARKYLHVLSHTLFYSDWASEQLNLLGNEKAINHHPEYGRLRQLRYKDDFLYSEAEMDQMLGLLFQRNPKNRMAFEYLLAFELMNRDMERFNRYYPLGKDLGYTHIPLSYQEALVFMWTQTHKSFEGMPWSIDEGVARRVTEFARIYTTTQEAASVLAPEFGNSYWYYLLCRK